MIGRRLTESKENKQLMDWKKGGQSCIIGFILLIVARWTGSLGWIVRLLGYIGIANGASIWAEAEGNPWMRCAGRVSTAAVAVFAVLQILTLTGMLHMTETVWLCIEYAFTLVCIACILLGLSHRKKEERK